MFKFLRVPVLSNFDFYETTRLRLTWNIHVLLVFALIPLIGMSIALNSIYIYYYSFGLVLLTASLIFMKRTGNYKVISVTVSTILYATVLLSMFSVDAYIHYIEPFWQLVVVLYVYFIHGKFWGGLTMFATILSTSLFFIFNLNESIGNLNELDFARLLSMGIELGICLSLIGYILHQFIYLKTYAEFELRMMNEALRKEKALVESQDKEKTILLQEIHHRVKNNLQIVMSLLRMQANKIETSDAKEHFNDAINRVLTMSLIHQKLYESDNLSAVDLSEYIESLASDILRSSQSPIQIDKHFSVEVPTIGMKTIVPVALIITELISNSVKHAFSDTENPQINLTVRLNAETDKLELIYSDNGTWVLSAESSFGTQLIEALTEQLEGEYTLEILEEISRYHFSFVQQD